MRRTHGWRILAAMVLLGLGAIGGGSPRGAIASCAVRGPAELAAGADVIFRGKVTAVGPGAPTRAIERATFLIDTGWKGAVGREMTVLNSPSGSVSGRLPLARGQVYLVFARQGPEGLGTDACLGTRHLDHAAEALAFLGPGTPLGDPVAPDPAPPPPASDRWTPVAPLHTPRAGHTATVLTDGRILVAGGDTATAEVYDPEAARWTVAAPMGRKRSGHSATPLPDGRVLVAGGGPPVESTPLTAELYDPVADRWTPAAPMGARRIGHTATALPGGRVLVIGGAISGNAPEAEIYDPAADRWIAAAPRTPRDGHTATLLLDGTVLVAGGDAGDGATASAERYDPVADRWRPAGALLATRRDGVATLLPTGEVLVLGGAGADRAALASAERYDPATDAWVAAAPMATPRIGPTATLLSAYGGEVIVAGGGDGRGAIAATAERYDVAGDRWFPLPPLGTARLRHTATSLPLKPTGGILVVGGVAPGGRPEASAERLALGTLPHVCSPGPPRACLRVRFQQYWEQYWEEHGGLARFGLPLGEERIETLEDGRDYTIQHFERARFELHDTNAPPHDVQLGQLGRQFHPPDPPVPPAPGARHFPGTGHNVAGRFLEYWEANGGLPGFGLPLSEAFVERLEDGREYTVQYFERVRMELHPEHAPPYDVLLGQLGRRVLAGALKPPDSKQPAAGACATPSGALATVRVNGDVPLPRCQLVRPEQHLQIVNNTDRPVRGRLAHLDVTIPPGEAETVGGAFGGYLAPGVHRVALSAYAGGGTELWLRPESARGTRPRPEDAGRLPPDPRPINPASGGDGAQAGRDAVEVGAARGADGHQGVADDAVGLDRPGEGAVPGELPGHAGDHQRLDG